MVNDRRRLWTLACLLNWGNTMITQQTYSIALSPAQPCSAQLYQLACPTTTRPLPISSPFTSTNQPISQDPAMTHPTPVTKAHRGGLAAGLPKHAGKTRQVQAFVSIVAGWFALYLPLLYNWFIRPGGTLLLTTSTYVRKHLVHLRAATVPSPAAPAAPAAGFVFALLVALSFDGPLRTLDLVIQATSGLPAHQPFRYLWRSRPVPRNPKERTVAEAHKVVDPRGKAQLDGSVPDLYAHRGASSGEFPENTLRSFERAVETAEAMETGTSDSLVRSNALEMFYFLPPWMIDG